MSSENKLAVGQIKFFGFAVIGFVQGGGGILEGEPRDTYAEARADAIELHNQTEMSDSVWGVSDRLVK